jgi:NAD+ kinase
MTINNKKRKVFVFYRADNSRASVWAKKITTWLLKKKIPLGKSGDEAHIIIVLGGDGAILEAARKFKKNHIIILGFNLGNVGFLASVRSSRDFLKSLEQFFNGNYIVVKRMMLSTTVERGGKKVFSANALNEVAVQNPFNVSEMDIIIEGYTTQHIRGSGVLVATATGSTALNLSAHGPIVMPEIPCIIVTELLDHNSPTPSIVLTPNHRITVRIGEFREHSLLMNARTGEFINVLLAADGEQIFTLQKGDVVSIKRSPHTVRFAELQKNYFFKSIQEKISFQ